ncbi:hypothetical protein MJO28_005055 [Puccinia striiformis f. sp. tritici]|uniref:Uncharacterized protein n=1 Tax=Puccinia striiformis f. sp. tritici TaxID=168172 RepID=A0ACC0EJM7_9BASI|nr:hypothetical protein MJO28_005055 [Puccinia striiformis f. sp. tritici]
MQSELGTLINSLRGLPLPDPATPHTTGSKFSQVTTTSKGTATRSGKPKRTPAQIIADQVSREGRFDCRSGRHGQEEAGREGCNYSTPLG